MKPKPETKVLAMKKATLKKVAKKPETCKDLPTHNMLKPITKADEITKDLPSKSMLKPISKNLKEDKNVITLYFRKFGIASPRI